MKLAYLTLQSLSAPNWNNIPEHNYEVCYSVNTFKTMLKSIFSIHHYIAVLIFIILSPTAFLFYMFIINYVLFPFIH